MSTTTKHGHPCDGELWVMSTDHPVEAQQFIDIAREVLNRYGAKQAVEDMVCGCLQAPGHQLQHAAKANTGRQNQGREWPEHRCGAAPLPGKKKKQYETRGASVPFTPHSIHKLLI